MNWQKVIEHLEKHQRLREASGDPIAPLTVWELAQALRAGLEDEQAKMRDAQVKMQVAMAEAEGLKRREPL